jgi:hypothetical protein
LFFFGTSQNLTGIVIGFAGRVGPANRAPLEYRKNRHNYNMVQNRNFRQHN